MNLKGAIFDLDGVISRTEEIHAKAWKALFDRFLKEFSKTNSLEFREFNLVEDYLKYVDGRPRIEGIKTFLQSREIFLEIGNKESPSDLRSMNGLGLIKDKMFRDILEREGVSLYESTISLIRELNDNTISLFVASSSKNCRRVLQTAGIQDNFLSVFDGVDLEINNLPGKPHPALFLKVIEGYNLSPEDCIVFEDSVAGVASAKAGGFFTIGIDRASNTEALRNEGADIVIKDVDEVRFEKNKGILLRGS